MPKVTTKDEFIEELEMFTTSNGKSNITSSFSNSKIRIEETVSDGKGEIFLDISSYDDEIFFIKIDNTSAHNIGKIQNHNDGIVLKVNLNTKNISVFLFELKKQLRWSNLKKVSYQLGSSYRFIRYFQLEECFSVDYSFFIVAKDNNIERDVDALKTDNKFHTTLFMAIYEKKDTLPILMPLCKHKEFPFREVKFGETILI
ncbi:MAG: hypothetical protein QM493_08700 [Sulfurovum sp.]